MRSTNLKSWVATNRQSSPKAKTPRPKPMLKPSHALRPPARMSVIVPTMNHAFAAPAFTIDPWS